VIIWANLDCEARWANQTLPRHVLEKISAAAVTLAAFAQNGAEAVEVWTPAEVDASRIRIKHVTVRTGTPPRHDLAWANPDAKAANDRRLALGVHERLGTLLPGQRGITSVDALATAQGRWVCKAPWTAAGRDRAHGEGAPTGETAVYLSRLIERFGAVTYEPWCERLFDLGVSARIDASGTVAADSPHELLSDPRGTFVGIGIGAPALSDDERAKLDRFIAEAGRALHAIGYAGPFGIDAFVYRTEETELPVFVVLSEDTYETTFGDGYFAYLATACRTQEAAAAWVTDAEAARRPPGEMTPNYIVREGTLRRDPDGAWQLTCGLAENERAEADRVALYVGAGRALHACEINARHTFGHVFHELTRRFGAWRLGFGPPPDGARVLVEGSAWITGG
jgi:hypothetical protein